VRLLLVVSLLVMLSAPAYAGLDQAPPPDEPATQPPPVEPPPADQPPTDPQPPAPEPPAPPVQTEPEAPETPVPAGAGGGEDSDLPPRPSEDRILPRLDVYFPEGELDLRVNRLINKTFFEGQVKYNFIDGDISAFLRYRYYGYKRTTQFTVFDSIEFDDIDDSVSDDFDRVRGTLLLLQWPHSYTQRTFGLIELDRISSNKRPTGSEFFFRRDQTNTFLRVGYQLGTPDEARSSAIAGETRARTERLFSAFREFGPGDSTITAALTYGFPAIGDFDYLKFEFEALKRFDITLRTFLIGRVRGGTFPHVADAELRGLPPQPDAIDFLAVPRSETFKLDGRENLKGFDGRARGTEQLLTTWEYFFPWFLESNREFLRLNFQNWYWILYAGIGTIGLDREIYTDFDTYIPDTGIGFESSFTLRKYRFFLSGIVAQALKGDGGIEARISVKSYR
ncbi:MAG TPA: hypothetical protein VLE27_05935, partial [Thermoanaerobaculia bacterium]|nr:hypothetical protein [Thermoanaerobaculia bacterium]